MTMNNANEILERLWALEAYGAAVRPEPTEESDTGWGAKALETQPFFLRELWLHAVTEHIADAWQLAEQLGVARPAVDNALRRALTYAADVAEVAELDDSELRRVSEAEVLDHEAAEAAARAFAKAGYGAVGTAWAVWDVAEAVVRAAWAAEAVVRAARAAAAEASWAAAAAAAGRAAWAAAEGDAEAAKAAKEDEYNLQREDLFALWPKVYTALRALESVAQTR